MSNPSDSIVVEQSFASSPEQVWNAITERDQMVNWFFDNIPDFRPEVGFETQFDVDTGERHFLHQWKILEAVPPQKIIYDWRYQDFPGAGKVTFEILEDSGGCRLRVTTDGIESFPQDVPEFSPEACEGGWKYFIQGCLKNYLESRQ